MDINGSTIANNTAFLGGAVANDYGGTMTLTDSTLAFNSAQQYGGAIDTTGALTIVSSTIAYNIVSASGTGGGLDAHSGNAALYDTIVALNTIGTGNAAVANDIRGEVASGSAYNLVGSGGLTNGVNNNIVGVSDPRLAPSLADNGGPTQTIALFVGSPAIGAGSGAIAGLTITATDQRGIARPATGFDIGAFQGAIPAPSPPNPAVTPGPAAAPAPASEVIAAAASSSPPPGSRTSALGPVIRGHSPFRGRNLNSKGHRHARVNHHGAAGRQSTRRASLARRSVHPDRQASLAGPIQGMDVQAPPHAVRSEAFTRE